MECTTATFGSNRPFLLPKTKAIFDRATGSTDPNSTHIEAMTTFTTTTVTANPSLATAKCPNTVQSQDSTTTANAKTCPPSREVAIGAGVGIPLGLGLLVALALLLWGNLRRRSTPNNSLGDVQEVKSNESFQTRRADVAAITDGYGNQELDWAPRTRELDGVQRIETDGRRR